jgi:hypothetical protein
LRSVDPLTAARPPQSNIDEPCNEADAANAAHQIPPTITFLTQCVSHALFEIRARFLHYL